MWYPVSECNRCTRGICTNTKIQRQSAVLRSWGEGKVPGDCTTGRREPHCDRTQGGATGRQWLRRSDATPESGWEQHYSIRHRIRVAISHTCIRNTTLKISRSNW
uniref:Uncharacterized protein n=1 Tax=Trypanosoma vivax (strain Y486) TaxID=1055687 RepID=G0TZ18_TRYVY|nr:hypothetical protein, unlikely [Trypanosoma vivax Y486]